MNNSIIRYFLGVILKIEGGLMLLPCVVSLIYRDRQGLMYLIVAGCAFFVGSMISLRKPENTFFSLREGCLVTALSWILLSLVGAIPFVLTGEIPNYVDALFETASGFTTTGASILNDVEALSHTSLFWRSFTHWIGGMGVLVFLLAVIPLSGGGSINLMRAESPGPSVGKLLPKIRESARLLYIIYIVLSVLEFLFLLFGKMPVFDCITMTFGTAGTGGFGVLNSSCADYTAYQQWVITIFMLLFGVNFNAYFFIIYRRFKLILSMEELRWYLVIIISSVTAITASLIYHAMNGMEAVRHAFFQVASIITTTGFSTADFNSWAPVAQVILVCLMFVGACAGSTGGGIKVSRMLLLLKSIKKELLSFIYPKSVRKVMLDGKVVEHEVIRSTNVYFATYVMIFVISLFLISIEGTDIVTGFTSVVASLSNIGPGLAKVGPTGNFSFYSPFSKIILVFDMIAGRLELFPMLILLAPHTWKESLLARRRKLEKRNGV